MSPRAARSRRSGVAPLLPLGVAGVLLLAVLGIPQALVLGVVEGITEYLPVSSTGHLILAERAMGIGASAAANAFAIAIQAGAIVAVLGLYRARVASVFRGLAGRDPAGRRLAGALLVAFLPAAVFGLLLGHWVEDHLFGLWPVVLAWFVGGVAIFALRGRGRDASTRRGIESLAPSSALVIGLAQVLALWPGTSRSLVTIAGGLLVGLTLPAAVEFSFLLGVVTLGAATAYETYHAAAEMLRAFGPATLAVGFVAAAISAAVAIAWLVRWIERHGLVLFGWWRVSLAVVVAALILLGVLDASTVNASPAP